MVTNYLSSMRKLRKLKKKCLKNANLGYKISTTTESPKMTFHYFSKRMNSPAAFFSLRGPVITLLQRRRRRAFRPNLVMIGTRIDCFLSCSNIKHLIWIIQTFLRIVGKIPPVARCKSDKSARET